MIQTFERVMSALFPVGLPSMHPINDLTTSLDYVDRKERSKGVDHSPRLAVGRVAGPAKYKRVIQLGPRTVGRRIKRRD